MHRGSVPHGVEPHGGRSGQREHQVVAASPPRRPRGGYGNQRDLVVVDRGRDCGRQMMGQHVGERESPVLLPVEHHPSQDPAVLSCRHDGQMRGRPGRGDSAGIGSDGPGARGTHREGGQTTTGARSTHQQVGCRHEVAHRSIVERAPPVTESCSAPCGRSAAVAQAADRVDVDQLPVAARTGGTTAARAGPWRTSGHPGRIRRPAARCQRREAAHRSWWIRWTRRSAPSASGYRSRSRRGS